MRWTVKVYLGILKYHSRLHIFIVAFFVVKLDWSLCSVVYLLWLLNNFQSHCFPQHSPLVKWLIPYFHIHDCAFGCIKVNASRMGLKLLNYYITTLYAIVLFDLHNILQSLVDLVRNHILLIPDNLWNIERHQSM